MIELITTGVGKLLGMGESWVSAKQEQATAKVKNKIAIDKANTEAKITISKLDAEACNDIDLITVKNKNNTVMDNIVVFIFLAPFLAMFVPSLQPYVAEGFNNFKEAPEWYQYILYGIVISELGLRRIFMKMFDTLSTLRTGRKT